MPGVVSMGPDIIRLGIRLQAISLNHSVRILHHLLLHTFRASMRFVHALFPFVFPLQVGTMIQESPSQFFPTASGISGRVPRRTTTIGMASLLSFKCFLKDGRPVIDWPNRDAAWKNVAQSIR